MTLGLGARVGIKEGAVLPECAPAGIAKPDRVFFNTKHLRDLARILCRIGQRRHRSESINLGGPNALKVRFDTRGDQMPIAPTLPNAAGPWLSLCRLGAALLALVVATIVSAEIARAVGDTPVVAVSARIEAEADETRLVFKLSEPVAAAALHTAGPDRAIVDLPYVNFQIAESPEAGGLVSGFRYGVFARDRSRIVIDLASPARVASIESVYRESEGAAFLTIALAPVDRTAFDDLADQDARRLLESAAAARSSAPSIADDDRPLIVIDPGHGGVDPGAVAAGGVTEKDIVLSFSLALRDRLEEGGRYQVVMTREKDVFVALGERVRIAREAQADLFVSVHADSISSAPQVRGLTVYTGSDRASDAASQQLAERENRADAAAGVEEQEIEEGVADILMDLTRRETRGFSHGFARYLVDEIADVARLNSNPLRQAGFRVLRAPDVPSVLIELGYLSSSQDIAMLMSEEWREETTTAMADAIGRYFTTRFANRGIAPVSP
ncbi:MAG: N-acetylmuramoyl-L-alanine amidase [Salinarimonadaceae bacterium]|nr:MAG: N-acetylmuramoyl-L-alanine amidase [Salinarimonadaceae bacterium]